MPSYLIEGMKKKELIIIVVLFLVTGLGWLIYEWSKPDQLALDRIMIVRHDSEIIYEYPFNQDTVHEYIFEHEDGDFNRVSIKDGFVSLIEATCPDQICVHTPKISRSGEIIVCLPHKLTVEIISNEQSELDGVSK